MNVSKIEETQKQIAALKEAIIAIHDMIDLERELEKSLDLEEVRIKEALDLQDELFTMRSKLMDAHAKNQERTMRIKELKYRLCIEL